jgi:heme-degrading monooxygenase HmoA
MIARIWHGVVASDRAAAYAEYLAEFGVRDYQAMPGNCGVQLLRRDEGSRVHFLLLSLWTSREAIEAYAGPDIERARYYAYDLECLLDPEPGVTHYEVIGGSGVGEG